MSVGHVARAAENAGIPTTTVFVKSFAHIATEMGLARTVITRHPMGRPLGPARDRDTQRTVVTAALELLERATSSRTTVELEAPFRPVNGQARPEP
ncbi:MAG: hypothetical protein ACE5GC_00850 [Acidimicrobiia bacterium]